jgi:hypothetical protein
VRTGNIRQRMTAREVHPTQGDTNPKGIARKTSASHTPANHEVQDTNRQNRRPK